MKSWRPPLNFDKDATAMVQGKKARHGGNVKGGIGALDIQLRRKRNKRQEVPIFTPETLPLTVALHSGYEETDEVLRDGQAHLRLIHGAKSRISTKHDKHVRRYWNYAHRDKRVAPDIDLPDTLKNHCQTLALHNMWSSMKVHEKLIRSASSHCNTRLEPWVEEHRVRKKVMRKSQTAYLARTC